MNYKTLSYPVLLLQKLFPSHLDNFIWYFWVANLENKKKVGTSLSNHTMCLTPCLFLIFPCLYLALSLLLLAVCIHKSHAEELSCYFTEDRDLFCNFSLIPILAKLQAIEQAGSFMRRSMTANQTVGADSKRYNRFQAQNWPPAERVPYQVSILWTNLWQRKLVIYHSVGNACDIMLNKKK